MKKILQLINDERKTKPLLATARIRPYCACENDGFGEGQDCGLGPEECPSQTSEDSCFECVTKADAEET